MEPGRSFVTAALSLERKFDFPCPAGGSEKRVELTLPPGMKITALPPATDVQSRHGRYTASHEVKDGKLFIVEKLAMTQPATVCTAEDGVELRKFATEIDRAVRFMETLSGEEVHNLNRVDFFTSHEALLLHYEQALTRQVPRQWGWFNLSTHFPWIGMRTAALDGAHTEYFRGIRNPIAVKVGPSVTPDQLLRLIDVLNPDDEPGRLGLIHRMGAAHVADKLPTLLEAVKREGRRVLWICDAMHGNTEATSNGYKTRRFDNIRSEIEQSFDIHAAAGTRLGGVHLELTGEDVTECIGGARDLTELDLARAYRSTVDPRLNYEQALETAMLIVRKHAQLNPPVSA